MYGYYRDEVADLEDAYEAHWDEPGYDWDNEEEEEVGDAFTDEEAFEFFGYTKEEIKLFEGLPDGMYTLTNGVPTPWSPEGAKDALPDAKAMPLPSPFPMSLD